MDDLYEAFLPQFAVAARGRVARAIDAARQGDPEGAATTARDMHTLVGDASLLGLAEIVRLARKSEETAKRMRTTGHGDDAGALVASLEELRRVIEEIDQRTASGHSGQQPDGGGTA